MSQRVLCSAMIRAKNEARWIADVVRAITPVCHRIFIMDDNSTDDTLALACAVSPKVIGVRSPFTTLDESRDKNWQYDQILAWHEYETDQDGYHWPEWLLCIDGDEILDQRDLPLLQACMANETALAWRLRIIYLWNSMSQRRVDGVYENFNRPSLFRIINPAFRFQSTPWGNGANFHCSSIPQELLHHAQMSEVRLLHTGYMERADRLRKYEWYNRIDPENPSEDCYRHIVQGDVPEVPADAVLMHAGPLRLVEVE